MASVIPKMTTRWRAWVGFIRWFQRPAVSNRRRSYQKSEGHLQRDLHDSGILRGADHPERVAGVQRRSRIIEPRMIQHVERFPPQVRPDLLLDREGAPHGCVEVPPAGAGQDCGSGVPVGPRAVLYECGSIEPLPQGRIVDTRVA